MTAPTAPLPSFLRSITTVHAREMALVGQEGFWRALLPTWTGALLAAALLGAGFGVYLAVDVALIADLLPTQGDAGRDFGVINFAIMLPQTFAPAICAFFVAHLGYPALFLSGAAVTLLSAALVAQIRGAE